MPHPTENSEPSTLSHSEGLASIQRSWLTWAVVAVLLFLGFFRNLWGAANEQRFQGFQRDSESLVLARLAQSRQSSPFSYNALLGWADSDPRNLSERDYEHQNDVYLSGETFEVYSVYRSSSGGQAFVLGILDALSPFSPGANLEAFRALVSLLFAATIALFVRWIGREFGLPVALFVVATSLVSQWLTLFGRNLFYFIWASYLPLVVTAFLLEQESTRRVGGSLRIVFAASTTVLLKCLLNGFDFIVPALAMPLVPFVYFARKDRWETRRFVRRLGLLCLGLAAAVCIAILVLAVQLRSSEGSLAGGLASIFSTLGRRTYFADAAQLPDYASAVAGTSVATVLWTYLSRDWAVEILGLRFLDLIAIFGAVTVAYFILRRMQPRRLPDANKTSALILATWSSLPVPIVWFLLFKGQAVVHTHTNYLAWHMPFTFFGYALTAWLVRCIVIALRSAGKGVEPGTGT